MGSLELQCRADDVVTGTWGKIVFHVYTTLIFFRVLDAEKVRAGLRHADVCPDVTARTKERIA